MKKIVVAPLNWGLGHATRCIPIINELIKRNFEPIIASDGAALALLQKEFPNLKTYQLPSYHISYSKKKSLTWSLFLGLPKIIKAAKKEYQEIAKIIAKEEVVGIISDNRFGVYAAQIPSAYITHQIKVFSGNTTFFTSKIHQKIIEKFTECWVPDFKGAYNLSRKLSHKVDIKTPIKFIQPLSRFSFQKLDKKYDILVLLSGPEPQRTLLEKKLFKDLKGRKEKVLFVRGKIEDKQIHYQKDNILFCNFMLQKELQSAIIQSKIVIARSGYSTIMDLNKLQSRAFFIPTPGQYEQEYLAQYLEHKKIAPFSKQDDFTYKLLNSLDQYRGFNDVQTESNQSFDFSIFK